MNVPQELKYDKEQHLWVAIDDNVATIGITDFAQDKMGDILFVELAEEDDEFERGDEFSVVESGRLYGHPRLRHGSGHHRRGKNVRGGRYLEH